MEIWQPKIFHTAEICAPSPMGHEYYYVSRSCASCPRCLDARILKLTEEHPGGTVTEAFTKSSYCHVHALRSFLLILD